MPSELKNRVLEKKKLLLIDFLIIIFFRDNRVFYFIQLYIYKFKGLNIEYYLSCRFCLSIMVLLCNFIIFLYCQLMIMH